MNGELDSRLREEDQNKMTSLSTSLAHKTTVQQLREAGLKPTRQRIAIADILFKDGHKHVSAEDLYSEIGRSGMQISLATVYNTLHQFTDVGLLREVGVDGAKNYFDTNTHDHQHFFLEDTNEVFDANDLQISAEDIPNVPENMEVVRVDVVVRLRKKTNNT
ncbi:MAG: iron response transcriptional regulator IrrA [Hyphomicrobiales bacterium]